ncbi:L3 [Tursiops truncatus papillomavirus 6]|uniref:L3 n=1 Tax=Tursiops truncatus papillomavirus 6 TaxID=1144382 RepID=H6UYQ2_PSPV|nr:L3 [Tursiops truncatus papillomavirus 6]
MEIRMITTYLQQTAKKWPHSFTLQLLVGLLLVVMVSYLTGHIGFRLPRVKTMAYAGEMKCLSLWLIILETQISLFQLKTHLSMHLKVPLLQKTSKFTQGIWRNINLISFFSFAKSP